MRKWLKRVLPAPQEIRENKHLGVFGTLLQDPNLWHLNRRSVSGAFAIGMFVMYLPPLGHTFLAAGLAIYRRVNLPISVALVWITNPVTIPPMYYFAYVVGCRIMHIHAGGFNVHFWLDWHNWLAVIEPLLLGCLVCATVCSVTGYLTIQALWRWKLMREVQRRRKRYGAADGDAGTNPPSSNRQL